MEIDICDNTANCIVVAIIAMAVIAIAFGLLCQIKEYNLKSLEMYTTNGYYVESLPGQASPHWTKPQDCTCKH